MAVLKRTGLWAPELADPDIERAPSTTSSRTLTPTALMPWPMAIATGSPHEGAPASSSNAEANVASVERGTEDMEGSQANVSPEAEMEMDM
jgi:hypothetical protein